MSISEDPRLAEFYHLYSQDATTMKATTSYLTAPVSAHTGSSPQNGGGPAAPIHKRTYQACVSILCSCWFVYFIDLAEHDLLQIPCRRRKVRCDLGPVDNPHEPPCVRCRRESKDCFFSVTRRKRKAESGADELDEEEHDKDDHVLWKGRRKSARTEESVDNHERLSQPIRRSITARSPSTTSPVESYGFDNQPFHGTDACTVNEVQGANQESQVQEVTNETAAELFQSPINIPGDALHLLLKASGQSESLQRRDDAASGRQTSNKNHRGSATAQAKPSKSQHSQRLGGQNYPSNIDPTITVDSSESNSLSKETIKIWSRLRFVRAGWFTAREAIAYIEYFCEYLAPLTPIISPELCSEASYSTLPNEEPMLTVTILTIASRYMKIQGPGGRTRSFMIHERLWQYLQNMITRMFWSQEQFGGGFCGAGARRPGLTTYGRGLRSFGTIERCGRAM